ncbi:MAG TPA: hypothetical protein VIJ70_03470 [Gaiellaceae bacterium]
MVVGAPSHWKWSERPEYFAQCEALQSADGSLQIDIIKSAIEDNVLLDPIEGSIPSFPEGDPRHDPAERKVIVELSPSHGIPYPLVIVYRLGSTPADPTEEREVIGWEIVREDELV